VKNQHYQGSDNNEKKIPFTFYPVLLLLPFSPFSGIPLSFMQPS